MSTLKLLVFEYFFFCRLTHRAVEPRRRRLVKPVVRDGVGRGRPPCQPLPLPVDSIASLAGRRRLLRRLGPEGTPAGPGVPRRSRPEPGPAKGSCPHHGPVSAPSASESPWLFTLRSLRFLKIFPSS